MKKTLFELTIEEFTRTLLDYERVYDIVLTTYDEQGNKEKVTMKGTYSQLYDSTILHKQVNDDIVRTCYDYSLTLNELDIYNYIEYKTDRFKTDKVRLFRYEMDLFYNSFYLEDINEQVMIVYIENGWDIPQKELIGVFKGSIIIDYAKMREQVYSCRCFTYSSTMALLNSKLTKNKPPGTAVVLPDELNSDDARKRFKRSIDAGGSYDEIQNQIEDAIIAKNDELMDNKKDCISLPKGLDTIEAKRIFDKAIENDLMDKEYNWLKGKQLLSCFAREMSLKLGLSSAENSDGTKRISWRPFEDLFKLDKGTLRGNYSDIQKTGINPKGSDLIDKLFI